MSTSHVSSWSRLLHDERDPEIVSKEQRNAPASMSSSDDDDSDDQPRLASPETFFAISQQGRPSTSSRALKTFGRANNNNHLKDQAPRSTDDESVVVPEKPLVLLGRLKTRTTGKKKKKTKVLRRRRRGKFQAPRDCDSITGTTCKEEGRSKVCKSVE